MRCVVAGGVVGALVGVLVMASPARALTVFEDGFDAETGSGQGASGQSKVNYAAFVNWVVSDGTVDLIADGDFGITCAGGAGKCVDLDGGTKDAGVMTSVGLALAPGTYELSFLLSGTSSAFSQTAAGTPNTVDVSVGSLFATSVTVAKGDPFASYGGSFVVLAPSTVSIVFANQGGDNFGAMLDAVKLELVPEPGTAALFTLGLAGLAARSRPRTSRA